MILDLFQLDGRVALVTGGRRGLGRAMAVGLAEAGADVACVSLSGDAHETGEAVEAAGRRFLDIRADLGDPSQRDGLVDQVVSDLGRRRRRRSRSSRGVSDGHLAGTAGSSPDCRF